ncbi:protein of unknown function DUF1985 [Abeliophyllum distichum]|uniref:DUF1985 domain-containing protein n=1 Tax=Abeliophyllum distichum TaxID=126358 RepID=A0ABD1UKE8_9LAMI
MASTREKRTAAETSSRRDKKKSKKSKENDEVSYVPNKISKFELQRVFMALNDQVSDEDVVKLAKLYLISCFLYTAYYNKSVDERHMRLVDRLECDDFAWGEDLYQITLKSFKSALNLKNKKEKRTAAETSSRGDKKKSKKSKENDEVLYVPNDGIIQLTRRHGHWGNWQVHQPNDDEIWFRIGGSILGFSLDEFCLTVGL